MARSDREDGADGEQAIVGAAAEEASTFISITGHFYRGEVERMTAWRSRLDQTTNWAVVVMAAILTFAFSSSDNPHYVLLIGVLAVGSFLVIESQRYQEYDVWRNRVRILQRYLLAGVLAPGEAPDGDWRTDLASDLRHPEVSIPFRRAIGHRLKRVYFLLLTVLLSTWIARITVFQRGEPWLQTAAIGQIPGPVVVGIVGVGYLTLGALTLASILEGQKREFSDEIPGTEV